MLGVNQLDFINYCNALKGNYRKGVHKMETLLENPTHAKEFASNLGGVSVVLGTPVGKEDRNSETLRSMLLNSDVANDAVYTWMGQFYEFSSWDELLSDEDRCKAMMANELMWRALSASGVAMGKTVATLAGLSCSAYADMGAVAASSTAMAAVASSQTAMAAVASSQTAMAAIIGNSTALNTVVSSSTAMAAIFRSSTALQVVQNNASAWAIFSNASSAVMGKTVAELAGLNPSGYADMNAIAASQTAMAAIQKSQTALNAIAASSMATAKYAAGAAGLNPADYADMAAVASSSTAMAAVASSQTAMAAVAASASAIRAMVASTAAKTALIANNNNLQSVANTWWKTVQSGFTLVRSQKDDDGVTSANSVNAKYIMFAIPGGYNNGSGITNCFHGHNGAAAGSASGSYTDTAKRKVLLGGGTFTETNDGMVRTWVYSI